MEIRIIIFLLQLCSLQTISNLNETCPTHDQLGYIWNSAKGTSLRIFPLKTYQTMTQHPNGTIICQYGLSNPGPNWNIHVTFY